MQQAPQQSTELTELEKIILKDQLKRHMRAEDALSFPPRTAGLALALTFAFFVKGNHLKEHSMSSWGLSLILLMGGFSLYSWTLLNRYNVAKRNLNETSLKYGVRPIATDALSALPQVLVIYSSIVAFVLCTVLLIKY